MFRGDLDFGDASLRVTLLGGGFGECVVVETSERVAIIDSAVGPDREPLALSYLAAAGRRPEEVDIVAATHFDLDHVRGLSAVVRACGPERLVVSNVSRHKELLARLRREREVRRSLEQSPVSIPVEEYIDAMELGHRSIFYVSEGTRCHLWRGRTGDVAFEAWAPASAVIGRVHDRVAQLIESGSEQGTVAIGKRAFRENDVSIVLSVRAPGTHVLLCGDLQATQDATTGWRRAVYIGREVLRAEELDVVKVAHHGAAGAVDDELWSMASPRCVGLIAPWVLGAGVLPTVEGLERLSNLQKELWITVDPQTLAIGPRGGRKRSTRVCWLQATYNGVDWTVTGGEDSRRVA